MMALDTSPAVPEQIESDGFFREPPVICFTEKIIEEEHLKLKKYIEDNYSKIRDVEREFSNLTLEMKLTAGPRKAALMHIRKKIETSVERIRTAKLKKEQARKVYEAASKAVKDEEAKKKKLSEDLNNLVQESSYKQLSRIEELKRRLEALNHSRPSTFPLQEMRTAKSIAPLQAPSMPHMDETAAAGGSTNVRGSKENDLVAVAID